MVIIQYLLWEYSDIVVLFFCRFIARPCALGLKIQANGPQKAQPNAILEKVFTAITKVKVVPVFPLCHVFVCILVLITEIKSNLFAKRMAALLTVRCLDRVFPSIQMRRGWRACPNSWTGMCGPSSAGSDSAGTRRSPARWLAFVRACKRSRQLQNATYYH